MDKYCKFKGLLVEGGGGADVLVLFVIFFFCFVIWGGKLFNRRGKS